MRSGLSQATNFDILPFEFEWSRVNPHLSGEMELKGSSYC